MKNIIEFLSSMRLAVSLFVIIAAASVAGTLMEQEQANRLIYGSIWFLFLLGVLLVNTTACLLKKRLNLTNAGSYMMHLGVPLIMAGALIGAICGENGSVMIKEGGRADSFISRGREVKLPFTVKLDKFVIEKMPETAAHRIMAFSEDHLLGEATFHSAGESVNISGSAVKILEMIPDFVLGEDKKPASRSDELNNPAVHIMVNGEDAWLFSEFPDFHGAREFDGKTLVYECVVKGGEISQYNSYVELTEAAGKSEKAVISVNRPHAYRGYKIYQASYDEKTLKASGFIIKKDPGVPVVYAGFVLLCLGMLILVFKKLM
jgi:cytochrome c biogenesis protein ResB